MRQKEFEAFWMKFVPAACGTYVMDRHCSTQGKELLEHSETIHTVMGKLPSEWAWPVMGKIEDETSCRMATASGANSFITRWISIEK